MSALGQKRTRRHVRAMFGLPLIATEKADIIWRGRNPRLGSDVAADNDNYRTPTLCSAMVIRRSNLIGFGRFARASSLQGFFLRTGKLKICVMIGGKRKRSTTVIHSVRIRTPIDSTTAGWVRKFIPFVWAPLVNANNSTQVRNRGLLQRNTGLRHRLHTADRNATRFPRSGAVGHKT
jgi:hypothetical protein